MASVWVVDDHAASLDAVSEIARRTGHAVRTFGDAETASAALVTDTPDVVLSDLRLPGADGVALLRAVKERSPEAVVVVITAYGTIADAVRAVQEGAFDFLTKPLSVERVEVVLRNAVERHELGAALGVARRTADRLTEALGPATLVSRSAQMAAALDQVRRASQSTATVLLQGESGTGKELLARWLHEQSPRASGPFVPTHLAALAEGVLESELFGHERGAFTDARARHVGRFEEASGGTLFLDEIGDVDARTQVKLLRVLQERQVERVGGGRPIDVDVRVVAATHKDLEAEVAAGRFRDDLFWRLDVVRIRVPPLRERSGDLPLLLATFLHRFAARYGVPVPSIPSDVLDALLRWHWPGNVRELENVTERLVVMGGPSLSVDDLPARLAKGPPATSDPVVPHGDLDLTSFLEDSERTLVRRALERAGGNKSQAARSLGLSREALRYKLAKYDLD